MQKKHSHDLQENDLDIIGLAQLAYSGLTDQAKHKGIEVDLKLTGTDTQFQKTGLHEIEVLLYIMLSTSINLALPKSTIVLAVTDKAGAAEISVSFSAIGLGSNRTENVGKIDSSIKIIAFLLGQFPVIPNSSSPADISEQNWTLNLHQTISGLEMMLTDKKIQTSYMRGLGSAYDTIAETTIPEHLRHLDLPFNCITSVLVIKSNEAPHVLFKHNHCTFSVISYRENIRDLLEQVKSKLPELIICLADPEATPVTAMAAAIKSVHMFNHIPVIIASRNGKISKHIWSGLNVPYYRYTAQSDETVAEAIELIMARRQLLQKYFYREVCGNELRNIPFMYQELVAVCTAIIEQHLLNQSFTIHQLCELVGMSYSSLFKKMKAATGLSVNGFIRYIRLCKAAHLLLGSMCKVQEAALKVGISDIKYFREKFIELFGMRPSLFAKTHRAAFSFEQTITLEKQIQFTK